VSSSLLNLPSAPPGVEITIAAGEASGLAALPAGPGVFTISGADGGVIALAATANVRRLAKARVEALRSGSDHPAQQPLVISATGAGSAFEADWIWLQTARRVAPHSYQGMLDRWRGWFLHVDPAASFPQFLKTTRPYAAAPSSSDVYLGPFPDKHTAGRYIELLESLFDLCRYHHILALAPLGTACAYKEMGKCPGPCDGSVPMDHYRKQIEAAVEFATTPAETRAAALEAKMRSAAAASDYESAARHRGKLEESLKAMRPEFSLISRLEQFRFLALMPSEKSGWTRVILILGGWIEPLVDARAEPDREAAADILAGARDRAAALAESGHHPGIDASEAAAENIGLVCWHLFRPKQSRSAGVFLRLDGDLDLRLLRQSLRRAARQPRSAEAEAPVADHVIDVDITGRR
jgi:excinuclease UvrABC nuclease subunit